MEITQDLVRSAELAKLAYDIPIADAQEFLDEQCNFNGGEVVGAWSTHRGVQVVVVEYPKEFIILFRGSDQLIDWVHNLRKFGCPTRIVDMDEEMADMKVHYGLANQIFTIGQDIREVIKGNKRKLVIGHSAGAAQAAMFRYFFLSSYKNVDVHMFGCPGFGNEKFVEEYNRLYGERTYNIRNKNDVVTWINLNADSPGTKVYIDHKNHVHRQPSLVRRIYNQIVQRAKAAVMGTTLWSGAVDHFMDQYVSSMHKARSYQIKKALK